MKTFAFALLLSLWPLAVMGASTERGFTLEYDEPTTSECGDPTVCPLDDLDGTNVYIDVITDGDPVTIHSIPATSLQGGGKITQDFCVPVKDATTGQTIEIFVTAMDQSGNESHPTETIVHPIPGTRDCSDPAVTPPAAPTNLRLVE